MIDVGVNLNHSFFTSDLDQFLTEISEAEVSGAICIASDLNETALLNQLISNYENLWMTAGCHPHQAKTWDKNTKHELEHHIKCSVAIGETGLDYNRNYSTPDQQRVAFIEQIQLANQYQKPLYLHERDAHEDMVSILRSTKEETTKGVLHCFTGSISELKAYLDLDLYIGITGWLLDERRSSDLREAVKYIPDDKLLIETDAPYLVPRNIRPRPKKNHPKYLPYIAEELANIRENSLENLILNTDKNVERLFGISTKRLAN